MLIISQLVLWQEHVELFRLMSLLETSKQSQKLFHGISPIHFLMFSTAWIIPIQVLVNSYCKTFSIVEKTLFSNVIFDINLLNNTRATGRYRKQSVSDAVLVSHLYLYDNSTQDQSDTRFQSVKCFLDSVLQQTILTWSVLIQCKKK